jgi:putative sigma-54 modulation protein
MNLHISFKHMDHHEGLKEFIETKSETFKKYFNGKITVNWNLSVEKINQIAHCHLLGDGMDYFAESTTTDFRTSVENALDKVEKQLRKHKEIVTDHLHRNGHRTPGSASG